MIVLSATAGVLVESDWRPRMESHVKRGQWKSALALLQTVRAENGEVSGGTWNAVISSCARARPPAWEEALRILEMVPPEQASVKHFTSALAACNSAFGQEPQWEAALWLMDEMGARGVQADQYAVAGCLMVPVFLFHKIAGVDSAPNEVTSATEGVLFRRRKIADAERGASPDPDL